MDTCPVKHRASLDSARTFKKRSIATLLIVVLCLFLYACHSTSQSAAPKRLLRVRPIDTTIIFENDSNVIASINRIVRYGDYCVILGYNDDGVAVRSAITGRILFGYTIPLDVTDSVFAIEKDALVKEEGRLLLDGSQIYAASRRIFSPEAQALQLRHKILGVSFADDSTMLIHAHIAGIHYNPTKWRNGYATGWTQALLRVRIPSCRLVSVLKLPTWNREYQLTSASINRDGSIIVFGAVDRRWFASRKPFTQNSMCVFSVHERAMQFFAERDSGNFSSSASHPAVLWRNRASFLFANGDDLGIRAQDDALLCRIPTDSNDVATRKSKHLIRGISGSEHCIGMYRLTIRPNGVEHELHIYAEDGRYLGSVAVSADRDEPLYALLDTDETVSVYFKGEDVYRVRYAIDGWARSRPFGAQ
jgi:hypothetical protein